MSNVVIPLGAFGGTEIILIVLAILLLFGGRKIPELMKGLGSGIKEFKNASKDEDITTKPETTPKSEDDKKNM